MDRAGQVTRRRWGVSYREAWGHAIVVAALGWLAVAAFVVSGRGDRSAFGPLKWTDFVHFYTLGDVARTRDGHLLFDSNALHDRQTALVPASKDDVFVAVYGPQTALLFAPFSRFSYLLAGGLWAAITVAVYGLAVWFARRAVGGGLPDGRFVVAAALAFPPVWQLVMYGQSTAFVLMGFAGALWGLHRDRRFVAGVALSLLSVKPQWGVILGPLLLVCREGRLLGGILAGVAIQALLVTLVFDWAILPAYLDRLRNISQFAGLLEPAAYKMHSIRALTHLLPGWLDWLTWGALGAVALALTIRVWRAAGLSLNVRFGVLVLASALVNPHLTIYDVTLLVLPGLLIGGHLNAHAPESRWFWQRCYWVSAALLLPTARLIVVQATPILLAELLLRVAGRIRPDGAFATPERRTVGLPRVSGSQPT